MELLENNIIQQKLNSLDTLPEGYTPSMASKFELLMTAAPTEKKQSKWLYFIPAGIAATIALLILVQPDYTSVDCNTQHYAGRLQYTEVVDPVQVTETPSVAVKQTRSKRTKPVLPAVQLAVAPAPLTTRQPEEEVVAVDTTTQLLASAPVVTQKKIRFTEVDFDDAPLNSPVVVQQTPTGKQKFSFRFNLYSTAAQSPGSQPTPVQIRKNF